MIGRRPHRTRVWLSSRLATRSIVGRHHRRDGCPEPLWLVLAQAPRIAFGRTSGAVPRSPASPRVPRIDLVLAPRIEVSITQSAQQPPLLAMPDLRPAAVLTERVERVVRQVERYSTRIERTDLVGPPQLPPTARAGEHAATPSATLDAAPRLVIARNAPPAVAAEPAPTERPAPSSPPDRSFTWQPPDAAALADGVLRELDRRIVAERERLGRL